jgi:hypothetical protein
MAPQDRHLLAAQGWFSSPFGLYPGRHLAAGTLPAGSERAANAGFFGWPLSAPSSNGLHPARLRQMLTGGGVHE